MLSCMFKQPEAVVQRDCSKEGFEEFMQRPLKSVKPLKQNESVFLSSLCDGFLSVD